MTTLKIPVVYLKPGEFRLSRNPEIIITILGSCLALIMYDGLTGICAAAHCVLPEVNTRAGNEGKDVFKYVDSSFFKIIEIFGQLKIPEERISIKLFGGAQQVVTRVNGKESVGIKNIKKVLQLVERRKMKIVASDMGGNEGRKIYLLSNTGEVLLTRLNNKNNPNI